LSGILAEQADEVIAEMEKAGLKLVQKYPDGKWLSLVVSR
jgi:ribosomal protein L11 methylase PrmA